MLIYTCSGYGATLTFIWSVSDQLVDVSPSFSLFSLCFWSPPPPEGKYLPSLSGKMLHCVHQRIPNSCCLQFGAEKVLYRLFLVLSLETAL